MNDELSPELRELLSAERAAPSGLSETVRAQVEKAVLTRVGMEDGPANPSWSGLAKPGVVIVAAALVGGAIGYVSRGERVVLTPGPVRIPSVVSVPEPAASAPPVEPPQGLALPPSALPPIPSVPTSGPSARAPEDAKDTLAEERLLLAKARSALAVQDFSGALGATAEHEKRFPSGILSQERDAMKIRALLGGGQTAEGIRRLRVFRERYPRSALLPALESLVPTEKVP